MFDKDGFPTSSMRQARRLVIRGFFREVINRISVPELRDRLEQIVERELELSGA